MTTWNEFRDQMDSIPEADREVIDMLTVLQATRLERGISQKDFADRIGMKPSQLARLERPDAMPTLATLERYARGLGMKVSLTIHSV